MKITKQQLKRIIREEKARLVESGDYSRDSFVDHDEDIHELPPDVEGLMSDVEAALGQLTTAMIQLERLDPQAFMDAARYVAEEVHAWR